MASLHPFLLPLLFLLINPFSARITLAQLSDELVETVCSRTNEHDFCVPALLSDARSSTADLPTLAQVTIDLVVANATDTLSHISSLISTSTDPVLKSYLNDCLTQYQGMTIETDKATKDLESKRYSTIKIDMATIGYAALECETRFEKEPARVSPITTRNENIIGIEQIGEVISDLLGGSS
ncbi:putative invertase inhibitor [Tasmannia lanceolata]|uniref:putative invertase inhibitor n=1 Tax=Tasmannia lanceolata TaxID=3420 RepID=UPI004064B132